MGQAISYNLLQSLKRGAERLSDEARQRVCRYVESQRNESEAFMNRGRQADLYYTLFGWMLCYALNISTDSRRRKAYLQTCKHGSALDDLHQTAWTLCHQLDRLLALPRFTPDAILQSIADDEPLRRFFETYRQHGSGENTNSWAASLAVEAKDDTLVGRLLAAQHECGGFLSCEGAPMPDMLSTAVAVFALSQQHACPQYDIAPFIEAHWLPDGSFTATLLDEHGDVEYVFYGLLAIGCI